MGVKFPGTTTLSLGKSKMRCMQCGELATVLQVNPNGKRICYDCATPKQRVPLKPLDG